MKIFIYINLIYIFLITSRQIQMSHLALDSQYKIILVDPSIKIASIEPTINVIYSGELIVLPRLRCGTGYSIQIVRLKGDVPKSLQSKQQIWMPLHATCVQDGNELVFTHKKTTLQPLPPGYGYKMELISNRQIYDFDFDACDEKSPVKKN